MHRLLILCLLIALVGVVFLPVLGHEFVLWDDDVNVYANPNLHPVTGAGVARFWARAYMSLYIPLTYSVWAAAALVSQGRAPVPRPLAPGVFHGVNLLVHLGSVVLVFGILRILLREPVRLAPGASRDGEAASRRDRWAALFGAAVFGIHPVQVEPVAWVTGLKDVLCGFFALLAVWQFLLFAQQDERPHAGGRPGRAGAGLSHAVMAGAAYVLALLSKPTAVVVPLLCACLLPRVWAGQGTTAAAKAPRAGAGSRTHAKATGIGARRAVPLWFLLGEIAVAAAWTVLTKILQPSRSMEFVSPLWQRPVLACDSIVFYLCKVVWPVWLGPDYGRQPDVILGGWWVLVMPAAAVVLGVAVWRFRRWAWWLGPATGLFLAGILPVLGFVPFRFQHYSTVADRYVYLSMLGVGLAGAGLFRRYMGRVAGGVAVLIVAACAVRSFLQTAVWQDNDRFFAHGIRVNPASYELHTNYGNVLGGRGEASRALAHYREALRIRPRNPDTYINIGNVYRQAGNAPAAVAAYFAALRIKPDYPEAHYNLGIVFTKQDKPQMAVTHYSQALQVRPDYAAAHNNVGLLLADRGEIRSALAHYRDAIRLAPRYTDAHNNLALALAGLGETEAALAQYSAALAIDPRNAEVHNNLGVLLADQGRTEQALYHYSAVLQLRPGLAAGYINLANALRRMGRFRAAAAHYRRAVALAPQSPEAHYNLGLLLAGQGRTQEAIRHVSLALQFRPGFTQARTTLEQLVNREAKHPERHAP
ncbi:MAG: tetratricopeptide repeat protein [Kiritimatiellae bacterium]|nr:tetratricopeptide repeat protein [Kiritimatiellia bacterium]